MKVIVKRITEPNSRRQTWLIIGHEGNIPEGLTVGLNGGYAGIWSAVADYPSDGKMKSVKARILRTWTERIDEETFEQTRFAEIELMM